MTIKNLKLITLCISICLSFCAWSIDDYMVTITQVSKSGKTISVDSGFSNMIMENDYGILVEKIATSNKDFIFKPVAKLRVVKVESKTSIWVAYKTFIPKKIVPGKRLFLFSETAFLKGRKTQLSTKRTKLVTNNGASKEVKEFLLEGDDLAKKNKDYHVLTKAHKKEEHLEKEVHLIDIDKWEKDSSSDKLFASGIYRSPYAKEFSDRKKVQTFEKMVVAFLRKYNDPTFDYDSFYEEQKRSGGSSDDFQDRSSYISFYQRYKKKKLNREQKTEKFIRKVQEKGDAWSADYSDEELSEVLNNMSVAQERVRRKKLLAFKYNYQLYGSINLNLLNNENPNDPRTSEQNKYDFDFAWEGYFFKKLQDLKRFTVEASARRSQDGLYGGEANFKSVEYSVAAHINWYPYHIPSMVGVNIPYIGLVFRTGIVTLSSDSLGEQGNYQMTGFPGIRGGIKYNFENSYGVRLTGSFERLNLERLVRNADTGLLPDRTSYLDGKIGIGLSKFY